MEKIRTFVKEHRPLHKMLPLSAPLYVGIEISDKCNFSCKFCYHSLNNKNDTASEITMDYFEKLINDLSEFEEQIDTLYIGGDVEPLQHPLFPEFVKIAKDSNVAKTLKMSTNVSLLTPGLSHRIIDAGMDIIQISINGMDDEHYRQVTNRDVNFSSIKENITYLYSIKKAAHIHIKCIGDYFSEKQREEFMKVFTPLCDSINIETLANNWLDLELDINEWQNRFGIQSSESSLICSRPFYSMIIHYNGKVNACPLSKNLALSIGNANAASLKDIWNSKELLDLRLAFLRGNYKDTYQDCSKCKFTEFQTSEDLTPYRDELIHKYIEQGHC